MTSRMNEAQPEKVNMTDEIVQHQKMDIVVVLLFEEEILDHLDGISEAMRHIPKYWSVTDKDREAISRLFSNPIATSYTVKYPIAMSHTVKFSTTVEGDKAYLDNLLELVKEKGSIGGKKLLLPGLDGLLHCKVALAGEKGGVLKTYSDMLSKSTTEKEVYGYCINLDERSGFYADVRDISGDTVFEIRAGNSLGEDESSIFEDGFMSNTDDIGGLTVYLRDIGVISGNAHILNMSDFEQELEKRQEHTTNQARHRMVHQDDA